MHGEQNIKIIVLNLVYIILTAMLISPTGLFMSHSPSVVLLHCLSVPFVLNASPTPS